MMLQDEALLAGTEEPEANASRPLANQHQHRPGRKSEAGKKTPCCLECARLKVKCVTVPCARCFALCGRCRVPSRRVPYVELALRTVDPARISSAFYDALMRGLGQGRVRKQFVRLRLMTWRAQVVQAGYDVTYGALGKALASLGMSQVDLEDSRSLSLDCPPAADAFIASRELELTQQILSSRLFKELDDGFAALMVWLRRPTESAIALNEEAVSMIQDVSVVYRYVKRERVLPEHVFASLVCPDDWPALCDARLSREATSCFVKMCNRDGNIDLYIVKTRHMESPEFPGGMVEVTTFEKAPLSRHITRRPNSKHRIVEQHRVRGASQEEATPVKRKAVRLERVHVPGIATVPFPFPLPVPSSDSTTAPAPRTPAPTPPSSWSSHVHLHLHPAFVPVELPLPRTHPPAINTPVRPRPTPTPTPDHSYSDGYSFRACAYDPAALLRGGRHGHGHGYATARASMSEGTATATATATGPGDGEALGDRDGEAEAETDREAPMPVSVLMELMEHHHAWECEPSAANANAAVEAGCTSTPTSASASASPEDQRDQVKVKVKGGRSGLSEEECQLLNTLWDDD